MEECLMCLCDLRVPFKLKGIFLSDIGITDDVVHDRVLDGEEPTRT
jgi:hypothetical protein